MRRRLVLCGSLFFLVTLASAWLLWQATRPAHRITEDSALQIKSGMTCEEVEATFQIPAGDYTTRPTPFFITLPNWTDEERNWVGALGPAVWSSNDVEVRVYFDNHHRVVATRFYLPAESSLWDSVRRMLRVSP